MNRKTLLLLVLSMALLALVIGCGSKEDTTANVGDVADKAKEVGGETVDTVVAVGFDAVKTEYIAVAKTTVDEWNTKIVDCESRITELPAAAQKGLAEPVKALKEKGAALAATVAGLEGATEETFEAEKTKVETSVSDVKTAYEKVMGLL